LPKGAILKLLRWRATESNSTISTYHQYLFLFCIYWLAAGVRKSMSQQCCVSANVCRSCIIHFFKTPSFLLNSCFYWNEVPANNGCAVAEAVRVPQLDKTRLKTFQVQNPCNCTPFNIGLLRSV